MVKTIGIADVAVFAARTEVHAPGRGDDRDMLADQISR